MLTEVFTNPQGILSPISGQQATPYGMIEYHTHTFTPNPLPQHYATLDPSVIDALGRANISLAKLSELGTSIPNPDLLRQPTMQREAQSTSALEGTYERLDTVLAQPYQLGDSKDGWKDSLIEVFNYVDAAAHGIHSIQQGRPIGLSLVCELQELLVSGTHSDNPNAGTIRKSQVFIGSPTRNIDDARFVPTAPGPSLSAAIHQLIDWWSARKHPGLTLLDMAMFHYQFETLHPFTDDNGRIGRLLIMLQMLERGLLSQPLLSVSPWFEARRSDYQDMLFNVSARGEWDRWFKFFLTGIESSSEDALVRVKRLLFIKQHYDEILRMHGLGGSAVAIAEILIGQPYVTAPALAQRLKKSYSAIHAALTKLEQVGILSSERHGKSTTYVAHDVLFAISSPQLSADQVRIPLLAEK